MLVVTRLLWAVLSIAPAVGLAQAGGDIQAQILYAYHTEDFNSLTDLTRTLDAQVKSDAADSALRYHLAHAEYRLGELSAGRRGHDADRAFSECSDALKPLVEKDVKSAEALALQSACYFDLAKLRTLEAVLLRGRAADRLRAAAELAPRNPRVVFIAATQVLARAKPRSAEQQHGFTQLQLAAGLFEKTSGTLPDVPGWGHAEAYLALGRELQSRGDHLGARNWVEKSLIAAPDFKAAQRQLALIAKP